MMSSRRSFLKTAAFAAGASALGGPAFAAAPAQGVPQRFIFIRFSNGQRPHELALPTFSQKEKDLDARKQPLEADLSRHELPGWLRALEPHKKHLAILQGLSCLMIENGHYSYSSVMGCYKSNRNSLSSLKRATIDFELAKLFPSPFGHVELSLTGNYSSFRTGIVSGYSAPGPYQRNYCYADPQTAYNELFKSVLDPRGVDSENGMMQFLQAEEERKARELKGYEKLKLSGQVDSLEAIRSRNRKVEGMADSVRRHMPPLAKVHAGGGLDASTPEKQEAMTDILVAALASGLTNVVTYTIDELSTPVRGLPGNESDQISIHELGHNGGYSGVPADKIRETLRLVHVKQILAMVERLKKVPEGNGTLFDHTTILYFPEGGETHHGTGTEAPFVVLSGDKSRLNIAGRYIRLPYHATEGHKTLGNWYTTLLNAYGNPIAHYGDLDLEMSRLKLDQSGAIRPFLRA